MSKGKLIKYADKIDMYIYENAGLIGSDDMIYKNNGNYYKKNYNDYDQVLEENEFRKKKEKKDISKCLSELQIANKKYKYNQARQNIIRLIQHNIYHSKSKEFVKFITLTFRGLNDDVDQTNAILTKFIKNLKRHLKRNFQYILIPELHESGGIHYHGILFDFPYTDQKILRDRWIESIDNGIDSGSVYISAIGKAFDDEGNFIPAESVPFYITKLLKYITKFKDSENELDTSKLMTIFFGKKIYLRSYNLIPVVQEHLESGEIFNSIGYRKIEEYSYDTEWKGKIDFTRYVKI